MLGIKINRPRRSLGIKSNAPMGSLGQKGGHSQSKTMGLVKSHQHEIPIPAARDIQYIPTGLKSKSHASHSSGLEKR